MTTVDRATSRVAVIGDVGGHLDALCTELARLGAGDDGRGALPDDLVIVQVGDLVHRGPDSDAVVELVDRHLVRQPEQWLQLIGNHEAQYLRPPAFQWHQRLGRGASAALRRWHDQGLLHAAVALQLGDESVLVTHAGLTQPFWAQVLGASRDAGGAATQLDGMLEASDDTLFRPGVMLRAGSADLLAGPLWASASAELLPSWLDHDLPFSQVHGHSSLARWAPVVLQADEPLASRTMLDAAAKHESTHLQGGRIVGIDPGHGTEPQPFWRAWEPGDLGSAAG